MSIRFRCNRCHQLLGIAERKAGAGIQCPKCGRAQVVPSKEAAEATMLMGQIAGTPQVADDPADLVVYDDEPAAIEAPRKKKEKEEAPPVEQPAQVEKTPKTKTVSQPERGTPEKAAEQSPSPQSVPASEPGRPLPSGMILFPRRSFYGQAVLLVLLAGISFASGYFMGRGDANFELQTAREEAARQSMEIKGKLVHDSGAGLLADENAVVIVLPGDKWPERPLATNGLGPNDRPPQETDESLKAIVAFGGAYCRADASGDFSMVVPDLGTYRMLIVSRNARRPQDVELDEVDVVEIEEYLSGAKTLIGRGKYRWTSKEVTARLAPIEVNFGVSGQP